MHANKLYVSQCVKATGAIECVDIKWSILIYFKKNIIHDKQLHKYRIEESVG